MKFDSSAQNTHLFGLTLIGSFKLLLGLLLLSISVGIFTILHTDLISEVYTLVYIWELKVDSSFIDNTLHRLLSFGHERFQRIGIGTLVYSGLLFTEGAGLLLQKRWAEYLTVIVTGSLIPLEIYRMVGHFTIIKIAVLGINIAIVSYLVLCLLHKDIRKVNMSHNNGSTEIMK